MSVYLTIRTQSALGVRYDAPPPGRAHEGAVSLTLTDGVFAIFSSPDEADDVAHQLLSKSSQWRAALNGGRPGEGRHNHAPDTAPMPVVEPDDGEGQADDAGSVAEPARRPDPLEDTLILYPDPAALRAQADALMDGDL